MRTGSHPVRRVSNENHLMAGCDEDTKRSSGGSWGDLAWRPHLLARIRITVHSVKHAWNTSDHSLPSYHQPTTASCSLRYTLVKPPPRQRVFLLLSNSIKTHNDEGFRYSSECKDSK